MFKSLCAALLIVSTLGMASSFATDEIQLQVNESILIGNQRISCNGSAAPAAPATKTVRCTCLQDNRYIGDTGLLKISAQTSTADVELERANNVNGRMITSISECYNHIVNPTRTYANAIKFGACTLVDTN